MKNVCEDGTKCVEAPRDATDGRWRRRRTGTSLTSQAIGEAA